MAFPPGLTTCHFRGVFYDSNGVPDIGRVVLTQVPPALVVGSPSYAIDRAPIAWELDAAGVVAFDATATDNSGVGPSGWSYRVDYQFTHRSERKYTFAPAGGTVDLAALAGTEPVDHTNTRVLSVGGVFADPTGDIPVDDLPGIPGAQGPPGRGVTDARLSGTHLLLDFSDSTTDDVGVVVGAAGTNGTNGTNGADGTVLAFTDTGEFFGTFGALAGISGSWTVCPAAWRSLPCPAAAGNVLDWQPEVILGVGTATADAEFDVASVDNSVPGAPVILRALSSGTDTPLPNGRGGMYCWQNNARRLPGTKWRVQAGDIVAGSVTLAILFRSAGSGLAVGHATVYPSRVTVTNLGTPRS